MMETHKPSGISDIFIMRDSGECLYHQSYASQPLDADGTLISSLLSTIEAFSSNVDEGGAKLLETENYRFVYHKRDNYIYVARTKKSISPDYVSNALHGVSEKVKRSIDKKSKSKWDGNVDKFRLVDDFLKTQFSKPEMTKFYEITGRSVNRLDGIEAKIYSYLRFRGKTQLSQIAEILDIPDEKAVQVTSNLVENKYLEASS